MTDADTLVLLSGGLDSIVLCHSVLVSGRLGCVMHVVYDHPAQSMERRAVGRASLRWFKDGSDVQVHEYHLPIHAEALDAGVGSSGARVVPCRNLSMIAVAANVAATSGLRRVVFGATAEDQHGYPDCTPPFVATVSALCEPFGVTVEAPLANLTRSEVIALGKKINAPMEHAFSCYQPDFTGRACGTCNSCAQGQR